MAFQKLINWMRVHSRPKKPAVEGSQLPDLLTDKKEGRALSPLEVFSKLYYKSHVKESVLALSRDTDGEHIPVDVIRKATIAAWQQMQVSEPDKAQAVLDEYQRRKEEKEAAEEEPPTPEQIAT